MTPTREHSGSESSASVADWAAYQRHVYMGTIATRIAHEFNNLITPVLARSQDALERDDVVSMRKALTVTVSQAQRAIEVVHRLVEFVDGSPRVHASCELLGVVQESLAATVRAFAKDGIELALSVPADLYVIADHLLLEQALLNLLIFSRESIVDRTGRVSLSATGTAEHVVIELSSNGRGASAEHLAVLADDIPAPDPLTFATDSTALALRLVKMIAAEHAASLSARKVEPFGFVIRLHWPAGAPERG